MSQEAKIELLRRNLVTKGREDDLEENLCKSVVLMAKEMSWTIDHIMNMGITQFLVVSKELNWFHEEEARQYNTHKQAMTFRR